MAFLKRDKIQREILSYNMWYQSNRMITPPALQAFVH